jgi:hypothetical protein
MVSVLRSVSAPPIYISSQLAPSQEGCRLARQGQGQLVAAPAAAHQAAEGTARSCRMAAAAAHQAPSVSDLGIPARAILARRHPAAAQEAQGALGSRMAAPTARTGAQAPISVLAGTAGAILVAQEEEAAASRHTSATPGPAKDCRMARYTTAARCLLCAASAQAPPSRRRGDQTSAQKARRLARPRQGAVVAEAIIAKAEHPGSALSDMAASEARPYSPTPVPVLAVSAGRVLGIECPVAAAATAQSHLSAASPAARSYPAPSLPVLALPAGSLVAQAVIESGWSAGEAISDMASAPPSADPSTPLSGMARTARRLLDASPQAAARTIVAPCAKAASQDRRLAGAAAGGLYAAQAKAVPLLRRPAAAWPVPAPSRRDVDTGRLCAAANCLHAKTAVSRSAMARKTAAAPPCAEEHCLDRHYPAGHGPGLVDHQARRCGRSGFGVDRYGTKHDLSDPFAIAVSGGVGRLGRGGNGCRARRPG